MCSLPKSWFYSYFCIKKLKERNLQRKVKTRIDIWVVNSWGIGVYWVWTKNKGNFYVGSRGPVRLFFRTSWWSRPTEWRMSSCVWLSWYYSLLLPFPSPLPATSASLPPLLSGQLQPIFEIPLESRDKRFIPDDLGQGLKPSHKSAAHFNATLKQCECWSPWPLPSLFMGSLALLFKEALWSNFKVLISLLTAIWAFLPSPGAQAGVWNFWY